MYFFTRASTALYFDSTGSLGLTAGAVDFTLRIALSDMRLADAASTAASFPYTYPILPPIGLLGLSTKESDILTFIDDSDTNNPSSLLMI